MYALISWVATRWILVKSGVGNFFESLNVIHVRALINKSHTRSNECTNVKLYFYTQFVITVTWFSLSCSFSGSYLTYIKTWMD